MECNIIEIKIKEENVIFIVSLGHEGSPINPLDPIWKAGQAVRDKDGRDEDRGYEYDSKYPAAFPVNPKKKVRLTVTLQVINGKKGYYTLKGFFGSGKLNWPLIFSGDFHINENSDGKKSSDSVDVDFDAKFNPTGFLRVSGKFTWKVCPGKNESRDPVNSRRQENGIECTLTAGETFHEFYWLYDGDFSIFRKGVPVKILRYLALVCRTYYISTAVDDDQMIKFPWPHGPTKKDIITGVVNACFFRNPPRYDVYHCAHHFTDFINPGNDKNRVNLFLEDYLESVYDPYALCNCMDQAAVLQVFLTAVGIPDVKYCSMDSFGYLRLTNLVGRGLCNNPSYGERKRDRIFYQRLSHRDCFGQHYFCCLNEKVLDSCAGPHILESKKKYVEEAVDPIYPPDPRVNPGTEKDIKQHPGVTCLDYIMSHEKSSTVETGERHFVVCAWPDPRACPALGTGWEMFSQHTIAGDCQALRIWKLQRKGESVHIHLHVSSEKSAAHTKNRFKAIHSMTSSHKTLYEKGPSHLGEFAARSLPEHKNISRCFWIPARKRIKGNEISNIVFDVTCTNVTFNVDALFVWLNELAFAHRVDHLNEYLPPMDKITCPPYKNDKRCCPDTSKDVHVGEQVNFFMNFGEPILPDFRILEGNGLRLIHQGVTSLEFIALRKSRNKLRLAAVDTGTLLCSTRDFTIKIIA